MHSGWGERTNHARTDARACARDPPCAADAKNQCEAQMKYRMERKEMRRPHQAVLPRMSELALGGFLLKKSRGGKTSASSAWASLEWFRAHVGLPLPTKSDAIRD